MSRSRLLSLAAILASGLVGCAHCDTCDDFPVPCAGPGCNAAIRPVGPPTDMVPPSFMGNPGGPTTTTPTYAPPELPEVPAEATTPPAAPESPTPEMPAAPAVNPE